MKSFRILVATDFSNQAYNALFYATNLLKSKSCTFYILHVYQKSSTPLIKKKQPHGKTDGLGLLKKESEEKLLSTFHKIHLDQNNELHEFQTLSIEGSFDEIIARTIENLKIDLLVMGNKGSTGVKEIFMGSNTIKAIRNLQECPLLAVPKEMEFELPKEIAFFTDLKKVCNLKTLEPFLELVKILNASVHILHVNEEDILSPLQTSNKKLLEICFKEEDYSYTEIFKFSDVAQVVDGFVKNRKIDMFSLVYMKKGFIDRLFERPTILDLSIYADVPFLILPLKE